MYVVGKDLANNILFVAQGQHHPLLYSNSLVASTLHWTSDTPPALPLQCHAKIRYRQADQACLITVLDNGAVSGATTCQVHFEQPQWAVTPGQSVVFYAGEECLGGGIIKSMTTTQLSSTATLPHPSSVSNIVSPHK